MEKITLRRRVAKNGTLIIGGGFAGAHVARLLGPAGATVRAIAADLGVERGTLRH